MNSSGILMIPGSYLITGVLYLTTSATRNTAEFSIQLYDIENSNLLSPDLMLYPDSARLCSYQLRGVFNLHHTDGGTGVYFDITDSSNTVNIGLIGSGLQNNIFNPGRYSRLTDSLRQPVHHSLPHTKWNQYDRKHSTQRGNKFTGLQPISIQLSLMPNIGCDGCTAGTASLTPIAASNGAASGSSAVLTVNQVNSKNINQFIFYRFAILDAALLTALIVSGLVNQ